MFGKAGSAMNLRVPHPSRSLRRVGYANVGIDILDPSQNARRTPDFLLRCPIHGRLCGFLKGNKAEESIPAKEWGTRLRCWDRSLTIPLHPSAGRRRRWKLKGEVVLGC